MRSMLNDKTINTTSIHLILSQNTRSADLFPYKHRNVSAHQHDVRPKFSLPYYLGTWAGYGLPITTEQLGFMPITNAYYSVSYAIN